MTGAKVCTLNINLNCTASELKELNERIRNNGDTAETYIKKAICGFTGGALFRGDEVWGKRA